MAQTRLRNPLHLPEVLLHLGQFLDPHTLCTCIRLNRACYKLFLPFIWYELKLVCLSPGRASHFPFPPLIALVKHQHLVQSLVRDSKIWNQTHMGVCSHLVHIKVGTITEPLMMVIDRNRTTLRSFTRRIDEHRTTDMAPMYMLWGRLVQCKSLQHLELEGVPIPEPDMSNFLEIVQNPCLKSLHLFGVSIRNGARMIWHTPLPHIQSLTLNLSMPGRFQSDMVQRCSSLKDLAWYGRIDRINEQEMVRALQGKTQLERLFIRGAGLNDKGLARLVAMLPTLVHFEAPMTDFGSLALETLLRIQGQTLRTLSLLECSGPCSAHAVSILTSCPSLASLGLPLLYIEDVVAVGPWVCTRLRSLEMQLTTHQSSSPFDLQRQMYKQLARLTKLAKLNVEHGVNPQGLNFTLESGLDELRPLTGLASLSIGSGNVAPAEMKWMNNHWKALKHLESQVPTDAFSVGFGKVWPVNLFGVFATPDEYNFQSFGVSTAPPAPLPGEGLSPFGLPVQSTASFGAPVSSASVPPSGSLFGLPAGSSSTFGAPSNSTSTSSWTFSSTSTFGTFAPPSSMSSSSAFGTYGAPAVTSPSTAFGSFSSTSSTQATPFRALGSSGSSSTAAGGASGITPTNAIGFVSSPASLGSVETDEASPMEID